MTLPLGFRMLEDGDALIEGWLVPFRSPFRSNKDLYGTVFDKDTKFHLDWYGTRPLTFNHGLDSEIGLEAIGTIRSAEVRDEGVWAEALISQRARYFDKMVEMARRGELQFSSGSIDYMVKINQRSGHVDEWPIAEGTLTNVPGNPMATLEVVDDVAFETVRSACRSADIAIAELETFLDENPPADGEARIVHESTYRTQPAPEGAAPEPANPEEASPEPVPQDPPANRAGVGADAVDLEKSFEDIRCDIECQLNPMSSGPFYDCDMPWNCVVATYADFVLVARYGDTDYEDDPTYWKISYTLDENSEPVLDLASQQQMEQVYLPVAAARSAEGAFALEAHSLIRHAAALAERTKDLGERRAEEGRPLSSRNRSAIEQQAQALRSAGDEMTALLTRDTEIARTAAEAAYWSDPQSRQRELDLLELSAFALEIQPA